MGASRARKAFGPLLYGVLTLSALIVVGLFLQDSWPSWRQRWEVQSLAGELRSPDPVASKRASDQLARAGSAGLPWLIRAAKDSDANVRWLASSALGRTLPLPKAAIPAIVAGLKDPDVRIRRQSADTLARFGPEAVATVDELLKAMRDDDADVRFRAAHALARIDDRTRRPVFGVLVSLLADPIVAHLPDRMVVIPVIRGMGPEAEAQAVAALIPLIDAEGTFTRRTAVEGLQLIGPPARDAVPSLERALRDEDLVVRCLATLALSEIEGWESGRARASLTGLVNSPLLPPSMEKQVRWVLSANLVAGSEVSQPVHVLSAVVEEIRTLEARAKVEATQRSEAEEAMPIP